MIDDRPVPMALPAGYSISVMNDDEMAVLDDWVADEGWNPGLSDLSLAACG